AIKIAEMSGVIARKEDISGSAKLNGTETRDGAEWLSVSGEMRLKNGRMKESDAAELPQGVSVKEVTVEHKFSGQIPVDTSVANMNTSSTFARSTISEGRLRDRDYRYQTKSTYVYESRVAQIK